VVTYHLREAGRVPDVALIDGKTERETVDAEIGSALAAADDRRLSVENPAASLSAELLEALGEALSDADPVIIEVTGEEDLAALPAILAARPTARASSTASRARGWSRRGYAGVPNRGTRAVRGARRRRRGGLQGARSRSRRRSVIYGRRPPNDRRRRHPRFEILLQLSRRYTPN